MAAVSLGHLLGLSGAADSPPQRGRHAHKRLLVLRRNDVRAVCPADEVHGIHRFHASDVRDAPATVARAAGRHTTGVLTWLDHSVGMLDDELLFFGLERSLA
jgi:chemotaxis-related protein WspD